jgi:farnesyl-diphosphate farnesyltransferase
MNIEDSTPTPGQSPGSAPDSADSHFQPGRPRRRPSRSGGRGEAEGSPASENPSAPSSETRTGSGGGGRGERGDSRRRSSDRRDDRRSGGGSGGRGDSRSRRPSRDREERAPVAKAAPAVDEDAPAETGDGSPLQELGGELLGSVSRSFSLTINLLPAPLREPVSLGYLLARAMDTVADSARVPAPKRLEHLRAMFEMIKYGPDPELLRPLQKDLAAQAHDGERELIQKLDRCMNWLEAQEPEDKWELRRTLARIGRGQELDVLRFGDSTADDPKPLETADELDEYTYFVAGSVGELWTRLCQAHLPTGWSKLPESEMLALGKRFGQGLQMVNILRDLPADLAIGRCYLPKDLLAKHDLDVAALRADPKRARPLLDELRAKTLEHLDAAWKYVSAIGPRKLRYACALPVFIGLETLALLARNPVLEVDERVKMSRGSLRKLMASAAVGAWLTSWSDSLYKRLRKRAGA